MFTSETPSWRIVVAQQLRPLARLGGAAQVGLGDDLDQRRAAAVEVDQRGAGAVDPARLADVDHLRRVLLEVGAVDADVAELPVAGRRDVVLADLVAPSGCRDRSSSCGGRSSAARPRSRARRRSSARSGSPARWAPAATPGWARQTGQVWTLGSSPKESSQPQNIFVRVASWTWISSPITASSSGHHASHPRAAAVASKPIALLERVGGVEQRLLGEGRARRSGSRPAARPAALGLGEAGRDRDRRDPGQRHRHGEVVVQVHRQRVVGLLAELEGDRGRGRGDDEVEALEGGARSPRRSSSAPSAPARSRPRSSRRRARRCRA